MSWTTFASRLALLLLSGCAQLYTDSRPMDQSEQAVVDLTREVYDADPLMPERKRRCKDRELRVSVVPLEEIHTQCVLSVQYNLFGNLSCLGSRGNWRQESLLLSEGHVRPREAIVHETVHDALRCAQVGADAGHTYKPAWGRNGVVARAEALLR